MLDMAEHGELIGKLTAGGWASEGGCGDDVVL